MTSVRHPAGGAWPALPLIARRWGVGLCLAAAAGCQSEPPRARTATLVEVNRLDPGIRLDIRYATPNNFTGRPLYPTAAAWLLAEPAAALVKAHRHLKTQGYGIVIFDAYRPWSVTRSLWASASEAERRAGYVADPAIGSRHNRGCAVDVGLYDQSSGREVPMPSEFDDFTERAHADWPGGSATSRAHRQQLRTAMEAQGFEVLPQEWWHFNFRGCDQYPLLDSPIDPGSTGIPAP